MALLSVVLHLCPFTISRSTSVTLWHSSEFAFILIDASFWVAKFLSTNRRFLIPFDHLLQHLYVLRAILLGRWKDRATPMHGLPHHVALLTLILFSFTSLVATFAHLALALSFDLPSSLKRM
ncbi:hypothetical protein BHE74_00020139 [Ensete ventricosum]|nr:hypothetical protein BHE74_00020139 [Ensete ventricosum]